MSEHAKLTEHAKNCAYLASKRKCSEADYKDRDSRQTEYKEKMPSQLSPSYTEAGPHKCWHSDMGNLEDSLLTILP